MKNEQECKTITKEMLEKARKIMKEGGLLSAGIRANSHMFMGCNLDWMTKHELIHLVYLQHKEIKMFETELERKD